MSAQKKNLLEAFSNAGADTPLTGSPKPVPVAKESSPAPAPQPAAPEPSRAAPVPVRPEPAPSAGERRSASRAAAEGDRGPTTQPTPPVRATHDPSDLAQAPDVPPGFDFTALVPVLAAAILAFVAGIFVGRNSAGPDEVLAGGEEQAEVPAQEPESTGLAPFSAPPPAKSETLEESPLSVASNRYSVVVQTYTSENSDLAWATYHHLRDERLPVFPPVDSGQYLLVLVGAAPTSGELADLEKSVRSLSRNGRSNVYSDAYRAKIDDLIDR